MDSQRKQRIILIGENNLLNQMFVYCIGKKLSISSCIYSSPLHLFPRDISSDISPFPSEGTDYLFLIDCIDRDIESATHEIVSNPSLNGSAIALYNLVGSSDIEAQALSKKVRGFFYTRDSLELFLKGIKALFHGEVWISRQVLLHHVMGEMNESTIEEKNSATLTQREQQILSLVSIGVKNEEIAEKLCISTNTVKTHMYNIFKKIQVTNRLQAALWAAKHL